MQAVVSQRLTAREYALTILPGLFVGFLAGLVGLGGAEERTPFLLYGLGIPIYEMIAANLIISLGTSGLNFALRLKAGLLTSSAFVVGAAMIVGSIPGGYLGAWASHRISERKLRAIIAIALTVVLIKIISDALVGTRQLGIFNPGHIDASCRCRGRARGGSRCGSNWSRRRRVPHSVLDLPIRIPDQSGRHREPNGLVAYHDWSPAGETLALRTSKQAQPAARRAHGNLVFGRCLPEHNGADQRRGTGDQTGLRCNPDLHHTEVGD